MAFAAAAPYIISGVSALAGLLGGRKKTQTQDTNSSLRELTNSITNSQSHGAQNINVLDAPELSGIQQQAQNSFLQNLINNANQDPNLKGYTSNALQDINRGFDARKAILDSVLAARGIGRSAVGANSIANLENARVGEGVNLLASLPLLQQQIRGENALNLARGFALTPKASRRTGLITSDTTAQSISDMIKNASQQSHTVGNISGNKLGGLFSGLGQGVASQFGFQQALNDVLNNRNNPTFGPNSTIPNPLYNGGV